MWTPRQPPNPDLDPERADKYVWSDGDIEFGEPTPPEPEEAEPEDEDEDEDE